MFDLSTGADSELGVIVGKKTGDIVAPGDEAGLEGFLDGQKGAVDWLKLEGGNGTREVYRTFTAGGVPAKDACAQGGKDVVVEYAALYWFFG